MILFNKRQQQCCTTAVPHDCADFYIYKIFIMFIKKLSQRRAVILPPEICEEAGIKPGDFLELGVLDGSVIMRPKRLVDVHTAEDDAESSS